MKKIILLFLIPIMILSCQTTNEVEKSAGVWVLSGDKYTLGSDRDVEIVKKMIKSFNDLNTNELSELIADTINFYPFNSPNAIKLPNSAMKTFTSQYDSVETKSIHFLPYSNDAQGKRIVQTIQNENLYYKDGRIDSLHVLNLWFINNENKIYSIRQFNAAWGNN
ncbi:MAG: hypothetical protein L7V31_07920 [Flavobacteriaceae bacterium]|nr:hypothetical protein [Flavobacteriaceae bacterium]